MEGGELVKLAIISDEISQDLDRALELVQRHGFDGIEIRSVWNTRPHELSIDQCQRIRDRVGAAGVKLVAYDSPAFKQPLPRTRREFDAAARVLETSMGVARDLGCPPTRVFSFYREGPPRPAAAVEAMAKLLDRVPAPDVPLLLENGMRTNSPTAAALAELLELLGPRPFGALWDPGNAAFCGLEQTPPAQAYEMLRPKLRLVHVKDPRGSSSYTRLGTGDLPWGEIAAELAAGRFGGFLSLETHWRLGRILSQAERDEPWGEDFSCDGYEPSSICMAELKDISLAAAARSQ
jgi:sugar phosphate isomerase/epimerase